jgi:predicted solute-binding protein
MNAAVAMIPYANMAPYRMLGPPAGCRFVPLVPRASIEALLAGDVIAAAVPVGGLASLAGVVETVGCYGIAARGPCMSVLFFSRVPFAAMHAPRTVRITGETASSVRLLYLLLGQAHGFERLPRLAANGQRPDGELLIGDRALINGQVPPVPPWTAVTDLSSLWFETQQLPFVFARWVVRSDATPAVKSSIARWLETFKAREADLVERAVPVSADALGLAPEVVRRYFQVIRRCLDDVDLRGQARFCELLAQVARSPLFPAMPLTND